MQRDDTDLTEGDRQVERLYKDSRAPIPWDESDDAVLALARDAARTMGARENDAGTDSGGGGSNESTVTPFRPRQRNILQRVVHSPVMGFALAASLLVGMFVGQGVRPVLHLGVGPDYEDLAAQEQIAGMRGLGGAGLGALFQSVQSYECATVSIVLGADGTVTASGTVASAADLALLDADLAAHGTGFTMINQVRALGRPYCQVLETLAPVLPAGASADRPLLRTFGHGPVYGDGEALIVEAGAGARGGYLHVAFVQADGSVVHLAEETHLAAGETARFGDSGRTYRLTAPYGDDLLIAVATEAPLFESPRPEVESVEAYLTALSKALVSPRGDGATASYRLITIQRATE